MRRDGWRGQVELTGLSGHASTSEGAARMVDVGAKPETERRAVAEARLRMIAGDGPGGRAGDGPKGDVLGPARIAGIAAAKQTGELIPLAHPLPLSFVDVRGEVDPTPGPSP